MDFETLKKRVYCGLIFDCPTEEVQPLKLYPYQQKMIDDIRAAEAAGMVFTYIGTNEHGEHVLRTRVSNKKYTTKNALLHLANDKETLRMNKK